MATAEKHTNIIKAKLRYYLSLLSDKPVIKMMPPAEGCAATFITKLPENKLSTSNVRHAYYDVLETGGTTPLTERYKYGTNASHVWVQDRQGGEMDIDNGIYETAEQVKEAGEVVE